MGSTALTIGNFDGVHLGHRRLIEAACAAADRVVALSFDPHPATVVRPDAAPHALMTFEHRAEVLRAVGVDEVIRLDPSSGVLTQTPHAFLEKVITEFDPDHVVEGPDFRFGRDRAGTIDTLREEESDLGYRTLCVEPVTVALMNQQIVRASSTRIREMIALGRVRDAARILGRSYLRRGRVVRGDQRGRSIGVPTANLAADELLLPADGIYCGAATDPAGRWRDAAISVGVKPTFGGRVRVCEAHLVDWDGPLDEYDWPIEIRFNSWMRSQIRYDRVEALVEQLQRDIARVRELPSSVACDGPPSTELTEETV